MDRNHSSLNENLTFLTGCVSEDMTALEAACATKECWIETEAVLMPVIGPEGVAVLLRKGEEVAVRNVDFNSPPTGGAPIGTFCEWIGSLATNEALAACKAFLESVERYLVSLVGEHWTRRMLARRNRRPASMGFPSPPRS